MKFIFKQNFTAGVNLDLDEVRMPQDAAQFIKNLTQNVNVNAGAPALAGQNALVYTPLEGNTALSITLPSGINYCIGFYSSEATNEGIFFIWNSNRDHTIWTISGETGTVTKVYQDNLGATSLLPFPTTLDPQYFISEGRCVVQLRSYIDPVTNLEVNYKFLIFTNNHLREYLIEITSSIATNSFSTTFFTSSAAFYNPVELIHLGVPTPLQCMSVTPITPTPDDALLQNLLIRNGWQWRCKFTDIFGRESIHGIISSQYITLVGGGCVSLSNGFPRCVNLGIDAGNPLVAQIQIEFRKWQGDDRAGALQTGWAICDILNKYDTTPGVEWYNRPINPDLTFNAGTNQITYKFCADKANTPVDPNETKLTEPGLPRISSTLFPVNKRIGLGNNVRGFEPIDPAQIAKVVFSAILPGASTTCPPAPTCTIRVFVNIWSVFYGDFAFVRMGAGRYIFGRADDANNNPYTYDMVIADGTQSGLTGYLVGLPEAVISLGVDFNPADGSYLTTGTSGGFRHVPMQLFEFTNVPVGEYIFRLASHKVKADTPNLQATSTFVGGLTTVDNLLADVSLAYSQNPLKEIKINACSAFQGEIVSLNGFSRLYPNPATTPIMVLCDPTAPYSGGFLGIGEGAPAGIVMDGYLQEDQVDDNPIEMQAVNAYGLNRFGGYMTTYGSLYTDHNGYYWAACHYDMVDSIPAGTGLHIDIKVETCNGTPLFYNETSSNRGIKHGDGTGTPTPFPVAGIEGAWYNKVFAVPSGQRFPDCGRRYIEGDIDLCSSSIGLGGVPVVMTKGNFAYTTSAGEYTIIAHNRYNALSWYSYLPYHIIFIEESPDYSSSPLNEDVIIVITRGACTLASCDGLCTYCIGEQTITYQACVSPTCGTDKCGSGTCVHCRITTIATLYASVNGVNLKGVQSGGRYPVGFILHDEIGRHTFVQTGQGDAGFVNIPPLISYQQFALCSIGFVIDPSVVFPTTFTKMTMVVGPNTNFSDFFMWECDYVQFVDVTGQTNDANPMQIRLYYGSNNEYQKQYNFSTNVGWQFQTDPPPPLPPAPVEGDYIEWVMNGDGVWFDERIISQVTYDQAGAFITIDYTADLANLKQFALFKVVRPIQNQPEYYNFYEQCLTIKLVNGVPQTLSGTLPYVDSYLLSRILPIPLAAGLASLSGITFQYTNVLDQKSAIDTTIDTYAGLNKNKNGVIIMQLNGTGVDIFQAFPYLFESPSPADTWGSHISDRGRIFTINPYEAQNRIGTEIALSNPILDGANLLNGLSYFDEQNIQIFDKQTWGNISLIFVETSVILVICDRDHFLLRFNGSQLVANAATGNIEAQNANGIFMSPERKSGENYGLSLSDINTARQYAGKVFWLDSTGYMIMHNFSTATPTQSQGYEGYLKNKIATVKVANLSSGETGLTYFNGGIDPKTMEYYFTSINIPKSGSPSYINTQSQPNLAVNETLIIDMGSGIIKGFASFTPEFMGNMNGFFLQSNFFTFKQGHPYFHHAGVGTVPLYANFYGTQCEVRITNVVNPGPEKVKRYFYVEVYTKQNINNGTGQFASALLYCDTITTEKGQLSRLAVQRWDIKDGYQCSQYLCDLNTPADPNLPLPTGAHAILDGNPLIGRWLAESFTNNPAWGGTYFELTGIVNYGNGVEKSAD